MSETIQRRKSLSLCVSFLIIVPDLQKDNKSFSSSCPYAKGDSGRHCSPFIYVSRCMKTNLLASQHKQRTPCFNCCTVTNSYGKKRDKKTSQIRRKKKWGRMMIEKKLRNLSICTLNHTHLFNQIRMICICAAKSESDVRLIEDLPGSEEGERCRIKCDYTLLLCDWKDRVVHKVVRQLKKEQKQDKKKSHESLEFCSTFSFSLGFVCIVVTAQPKFSSLVFNVKSSPASEYDQPSQVSNFQKQNRQKVNEPITQQRELHGHPKRTVTAYNNVSRNGLRSGVSSEQTWSSVRARCIRGPSAAGLQGQELSVSTSSLVGDRAHPARHPTAVCSHWRTHAQEEATRKHAKASVRC